MLTYSLLKALFRPALRVFYGEVGATGPAPPEAGPLIVVANHPNTLLDPLLVGMLWRRELRFLTSSHFFRGALGWLLRATGCLPVHRQEDAGGPARLPDAQRLAHNEAAFRVAYQRLAAGEALLIFPEGTSVPARGLRPVKAGAARIALGAEAQHDWRLGVRILPVGLNYADAARFRSGVERRVGAPIAVAAYRAQYEANPAAATRALTAELRRALADQLAATTPPDTDALLRALEALTPAPRSPDFARTRVLSEALNHWAAHDPAHLGALRHRAHVLHRTLHRLRLAPGALARPPTGGWVCAGRLAGLLAGAPVAAWGTVHHGLAVGLPVALVRWLRPEVEYRPSVVVAAGLLTVPGAYALQTALVGWLTHSGALAAAYLATLPLTGGAALAWHRAWATARTDGRLRRLARRRPGLLAALQRERAALLAESALSLPPPAGGEPG